MRPVRTTAAVAATLSTLLFAAGVTASANAEAPPSASTAAVSQYTAKGSVEEAYVLGAAKGTKLVLVNKKGKVTGHGTADRFGSLVFREQAPGGGFTVQQRKGKKVVQKSKPFAVLSTHSNPPQSFFDGKVLNQGLNYVTVRDGVEIAMTVRLPSGKTMADGPFPTVIEYSGYQTAAPHDLLSSVVSSLTGGGGANDPLVPASGTAVGSVIAPLLGFAAVSVQMRGSGCSGGAFDLFGLPTTFDGYDAVEAVAAQPWVKGHKVGLAGISFSGITQLFVAGTQPPHLAAIAPMSVTDDIYTATGYPGGIFNKGFALSWITDRANEAKPAPEGGQPWAKALVAAGDEHCINNQKMRLQTQDVLGLIKKNPYRTPALFDDRAPGAWVKNIKVPTFWIGQYHDEQTGGHFPESMKWLPKSNKKVWITLQNGVHADSLGPSTITRWAEFLNLYVGDQIPQVPGTVLSLSGALYKYLADSNAAPVKQSRFAGTTDVAAAKAEFEKDPRVRLLMDNGGGPEGPGSIGATWEQDFSSWPVKEAKASSYFLGAGGTLGAKPAKAGTAGYKSDPKARPEQTLGGTGEGDAWKAQPPYNWAPVAAGKGLGFTTAAFGKDVFMAGASSLDVYLKSSAKDTDLQVTLSEVRPDGNETYVQNGWLRASHRKLDPKQSTAIDPVPTHLKKDGAPLPKGKYSLVRVPIFPVAHVFRAGSKLRVTITAPGGDRPRWAFDTIEKGKTTNTILLGGPAASKLVIPVVEGADAKGTPLPGATALRGEPNRTYAKASNGG